MRPSTIAAAQDALNQLLEDASDDPSGGMLDEMFGVGGEALVRGALADLGVPLDTVVLVAGHGEYLGDDERAGGADPVELEYLWCPTGGDLDDLTPDENEAYELAAARRFNAKTGILPETLEEFDPTQDCVWRLTGTLDGFERWWRNLVVQLSHAPSGDDDTFDYWPSGVRLAHRLAAWLDDERGSTRAVPRRVDRLVRTVQEVLDGLGLEELTPDILGLREAATRAGASRAGSSLNKQQIVFDLDGARRAARVVEPRTSIRPDALFRIVDGQRYEIAIDLETGDFLAVPTPHLSAAWSAGRDAS